MTFEKWWTEVGHDFYQRNAAYTLAHAAWTAAREHLPAPEGDAILGTENGLTTLGKAIDLLGKIDATGLLYRYDLELDAEVANFLSSLAPQDGKG